MQIVVYELGPLATNAYLLLPEGRPEAILIDAPAEAWEIISERLAAEKRTVSALFLTHGHWDHTAGAVDFNRAGIQVYAHAADLEWIEHPMLQADFLLPGLVIEPAKVDEILTQGRVLEIAGLRLEVREVPGHSPGSVLFYAPEFKCAFPGDAIMAGTVGRFDLPRGNRRHLAASIKEQIYTLPDDTVLYPGHGGPTTVGLERTTNFFVKG